MLEFGRKEDKNRRSIRNLARCLVWYGEEYGEDDPILVADRGDGVPGVELSFRMPLGITSPYGEEYILCGHMDGICTFDDQLYVRERKHTTATLGSYYFKRYSPNPQVSTYALASRVVLPEPAVGVMLEATQTAVNFARFHRRPINRTPAQNDEWLENVRWFIKQAERCAEDDYWPINEANQMLYGGNTFQNIFNKDPGVREGFLEQDFWQAPEDQRWDPLSNR